MFTWIDPHFGSAGLTVAVLTVVLMAFSIVRNGPAQVARLRQVADSRPDGRVRVHQHLIVSAWCMGAIAVVPVLSDPGVHAADYGLASPTPAMAGLTAVVAVVLTLALWARNRGFAARARDGLEARMPAEHAMRRTSFLLPRTARERWWGVATALSAGICEEIVYRGLLLAAAVGVLGLDPLVAALIGVVLNALANRGSGLWGIVGRGVMAVLWTILYLGSGTLLLPIAAHVALGLAAFVMPLPSPQPPAEAQVEAQVEAQAEAQVEALVEAPVDAPAEAPPVLPAVPDPAVRLRPAAPEGTTPA